VQAAWLTAGYFDSDWGGMVTAIKATKIGARATATLLAGTMLSGMAAAQTAPQTAPAAAPPAAQAAPAPAVPAPVTRTIKSIRVQGSQRIESETVMSYTRLRVGDAYTNETIDQAIKDLLASELLADVTIEGVETGDLVIRIRENPVINRVIYEGNKRLKEVAPYGGRKGVFDTNPYAFSMPLDTQQTTTSDFATSATAQGKLLVFRTNHAPVPDGWLIDKHGRPTTNVDDFYEGGAMLPSAGTKGYGMGFMAELFGDAVLGTPHELNWFIVAVDLKRFVDPGDYFQAANHLKQEIEQCPPADGFERVMWPGQPEIERLEHQSAEGIDYSEDELRSLAGLEARFSMKLN